MLLRLTGAELLTLATRGAGLPPMIGNVQWTDHGVQAEVDLSDVEGESLVARLAMRAAGVVQVGLAFADFHVADQVMSWDVAVHVRSLPMDRLIHLLQGRINSEIAQRLSADELPADTVSLRTGDGAPTLRIALGEVLAQYAESSPVPDAHFTSVTFSEGALQIEVKLVPEADETIDV